MKSVAIWVAFAGSQSVWTPSSLGTSLMPGYSASACLKPVSRSVSAGWPAMPRMYDDVALAAQLLEQPLGAEVGVLDLVVGQVVGVRVGDERVDRDGR